MKARFRIIAFYNCLIQPVLCVKNPRERIIWHETNPAGKQQQLTLYPLQAAARPIVNVYDVKTGEVSGSLPRPAVFDAPIRRDLVHQVHSGMAKNGRQAYAVNKDAGMQHSAESWGTGRAVSRIPRISGSGTRRSSQGAFGNMCRQGRMFAPTKTWRKWHRKISVNQRRYATAASVAATAVTPLVQARGHKVDDVVELPLVVSGLNAVSKTAEAASILAKVGGSADVLKSKNSRKVRAGQGKLRNRRYVQRLGPLVVHTGETNVERAFRNLSGVELCRVNALNLLQLAPGGHMGRLVMWTESAFKQLEALWGNGTEAAELKSGYKLPKNLMTNADIGRIINSEEVQTAVRKSIKNSKYNPLKKNPLRNLGAMVKLNPFALHTRNAELQHAADLASGKKTSQRKARRSLMTKERKVASKAFYAALEADEYTFGSYAQ
jgi:large subunit ribosomal protein L4e